LESRLELYRETLSLLHQATENLVAALSGEAKSTLCRLRNYIQEHRQQYPEVLYAELDKACNLALNALARVFGQRLRAAGTCMASVIRTLQPFLDEEEQKESAAVERMRFAFDLLRQSLWDFQRYTSKHCMDCMITRFRSQRLEEEMKKILSDDFPLPEDAKSAVENSLVSINKAATCAARDHMDTLERRHA